MIYIAGSILTIVGLTAGASWLATSRWPERSQRWQVTLAALCVPLLSVLLFGLAVVVTLVGAADMPERGTVGMVIFSMAFFLFYAIVAGLAVGIPTAMVAVRMMRR
ncbi:hypothetical protein [Reyranella sp.]|uniref:hypothetical protein n=1 Tax=Reyranella sp. TaxID=1929291 RepID=UPI003C7A3363